MPKAKKVRNEEDLDNSELDEDDDDDLDEVKREGSEGDPEADEDPDLDDLVLCQYDKVTRIKNKWKCMMKAGMMRLNGRDYVFHKGLGELEW